MRTHLLSHGRLVDGLLRVSDFSPIKHTMETLGALHRVSGKELLLDHYALPLLTGLGLTSGGQGLKEKAPLQGQDSLEAVSTAMGVKVRSRGGTRIGSRMARPEKAKERKMNPPVHALFPISMEGGAQRLLSTAITSSKERKRDGNGARAKAGISVDVGIRRCRGCGRTDYHCWCPDCGSHTVIANETMAFEQRSKTLIDLEADYLEALRRLNISDAPEVKCVQGMTSKHKIPEPLEKGILRAIHDVYVFKDGTMRFDMTDVPVTHFRPREIGLTVEKALELGYRHDIHGDVLRDPEQLLELKVQDFIPSENCGDYMVRVATFIDDLLRLHYELEPFYK
ncbi:MAG: DNA polymerase II large subunit, partial [Clostridia bacterium]|nr:DNA polymerase II large subunit [Clostridia bacterium]